MKALRAARNRPKRVRPRRWIALSAALLTAGYYLIYHAPLPFVAGWWAGPDIEWGDPYKRRHRIADGLLLFHCLEGSQRSEVIEMLGEPPATEYFSDWNLVYNLGAERGFLSIDSEWLVLRTDANNVIVQATIVRD